MNAELPGKREQKGDHAMKVIDVYQQYFSAECEFAGVPRRAVSVMLTATSDSGEIRYDVTVSFFPHTDEEDYAVSYDALQTETVYAAKGRRSKKREADLMQSFRGTADALASRLGGRIFWEQPLRDARLG